MHSLEDTCCGHTFTECELSWILMYTFLVTQTVAYPTSGCELAWFLMCTVLVTECGLSFSECELA